MIAPSFTEIMFLALIAFIFPVVLQSKGAKSFFLTVILIWLVAIVVISPINILSEFSLAHLWGFGVNFTAVAIGYGLPVLGTAICIWILKKRHASILQGSVAGFLVGLLLTSLSATLTFIVASALVESAGY